jgi:hypothetical protein
MKSRGDKHGERWCPVLGDQGNIGTLIDPSVRRNGTVLDETFYIERLGG